MRIDIFLVFLGCPRRHVMREHSGWQSALVRATGGAVFPGRDPTPQRKLGSYRCGAAAPGEEGAAW